MSQLTVLVKEQEESFDQFLQRLWTNAPEKFGKLLILNSHDSVVTLTATNSLAKLSLTQLLEGLTRSEDKAVEKICAARPDLVETSEFWMAKRFDKVGFKICHDKSIEISRIVGCLAKASRDDLAMHIVDEFSAKPVLEALNGHESTKISSSNISGKWLDAAVQDVDGMRQFLVSQEIISNSLLYELARRNSPDAKFKGKGDPWLIAASKRAGLVESKKSQYLSAFFLCRALGESSSKAAELLAEGLDEVYVASLYSNLEDDAWMLLDKRLPDLGFIFSWDHCQRIRMGIADVFVSRELAPKSFINVTKDTVLFRELVNIIARRGREGKKFLKELLRELKDTEDLTNKKWLVEDAL